MKKNNIIKILIVMVFIIMAVFVVYFGVNKGCFHLTKGTMNFISTDAFKLDGPRDSGMSIIMFPLILICVFLESILTLLDGNNGFKKDTRLNIYMGLLVAGVAISVKTLQWGLYDLAWRHAIWHFYPTITIWILCFIGCDFIFYWFHRMGHEVNIFWAAHFTHHSSVEYNFSIGIRNNVIHVLYRYIFWTPLCFIGFHPVLIITCDSISALYQFFLHTKKIGSLGIFEYILCTPSNHRVHHGRNKLYLDKNYGGFFIFWDILFGTFQLETEAVQYGLNTGEVVDTLPKMILGKWKQIIHNLKNGSPVSHELFKNPGDLESKSENPDIR